VVLTEEQRTDQYPSATLETSTLATEKQFYNISDSRIVNTSDVSGATNHSSLQQKFYETHGNVSGKKTGLAMILKVMAGDVVRIKAESYYNMPGGGPGSYTPMALTDLLDAFAGSNLISASKGAVTSTDINNIGFNATNISNILNRGPDNSNTANAYLNYILFDDQLHYVSCGVDPVATNGGYRLHDIFINYPATAAKNGYLYIYVSNESNFQVFFDNLQVSHVRSPLISEDHYYPYGERMFNLCSEALNFGNPGSQKKKYNGIDWQNDLGLNEYDAQLRDLDGQTGRWWQIDPKIENMEMWSPYASNYDNPILNSDPLGDEPECCGDFLNAAWDQIVDRAKGIGNAVIHPVETVKNMVSLDNLKDIALNTMTSGIYGMVKQDVEVVKGIKNDGVGKTLGKVTGDFIFDVGTMVVTDGVVKGVPKIKAVFKGNIETKVPEVKAPETKPLKGAANPKVAAAIQDGKNAHSQFSKKAAAKGWEVNKPMIDPRTGKTVIADAVTPSGHPVELKPNTPSGKAKGVKQLPKYERATGNNGRVIYYDPEKLKRI
jgi:RHS repeat-associated protein